MTPPLEIFRMDYSRDVRWLEPAKDIEAAKTRLRTLGMVMPGRCVLFSQKTGNRIILQVSEDGGLLELNNPEPEA